MTISRVVTLEPLIRFPEFHDVWRGIPLSSVIHAMVQPSDDTYPLFSLTIENGVTEKTDRYERSFLVGDESEAYVSIYKNQFAYNPMNLRFGALARHVRDFPVNISRYYDVFSVKEGYSPEFLESLFLTFPSIKYYNRMATGSLLEKKRVHFSEFKEFVFPIPSIEEQRKIASFLSSVDSKRTKLREKRELLETYKRGMMQKLFSQELRFKSDDGCEFPAWKAFKLIQRGRFIGGGTPSTDVKSFWQGHMPWISSSDIRDGNIYQPKINRYINDAAIKESATKVVPKGSLLIVSRVGVGKLSVSECELCTSQDFTNFVPENDNSYFLAYLLISEKRRLLSISQGTSIKGFTVEDLANLRLTLPCRDEQQKIADCLSTIDKKIDAVAQQIVQMETFKQGLLQKMFV
ncbi:restriction endonuclease subunit S [Thalassolituus sp.]|uniref:restriction endonuclease subunit S n=1 Tax=Thalassolituus sp. TaxID=2030822 RepID=UPI00351627EA